MTRKVLALLVVSLALNLAAGVVLAWRLLRRPAPPRSGFVYAEARDSLFHVLATARADVVMLGDSLTDWGEWDELLALPGVTIANRGVAGELTLDVARRLGDVVALEPRVVALLVGVNDLSAGRSAAQTAAGVEEIVAELRRRLPSAVLLVQGLLPIDAARAGIGVENAVIEAVNGRLREAVSRHGARFVDVGEAMRGPGGSLLVELSGDGVHLVGQGYRHWAAALRPHVEAALAPR